MIVVCGEALMDVFVGAETPTGMALDARVGGSPFNVALGLARLGQAVAFFGGVSRGVLGERLLRALRDNGVSIDCVERLDAPTTLGLVALDARGVPDYAFYGTGAADRRLSLEALQALPPRRRALQFGSYAMVVEPAAATLAELVEREHARGVPQRCVIAYDPNIRLNVEPDLARWRDKLHWMAPRTDLLKLSDEDLSLLFPGRRSDDFAADMLARGAGCVVVTRGGEGAVAWSAGATAEAQPLPVTVVDTVGAGDTFQAALLTWLAEHDRLSPAAIRTLGREALADALHFAGAAAAITCSRRGADLPRRDELGDRAQRHAAPP